ncbi:MAG: ATP-binding protein [Kibdelosporangium sp.]
MRDDTEGSGPPATGARLPWTGWALTLPGVAGAAMSNVDFSGPHAYISMPAAAQELPGARAELRRWAREVQFAVDQMDDVVLAVDEAVANAVEHAYPRQGGRLGVVTVFAGRALGGAEAYVVVSDTGHWRPPADDPGFRGRGVSMMKALADRFDLHHDESGTTVLLAWNPR